MTRWPERGIERIGSADGRIAVYLNEGEAADLARLYGPDDLAASELIAAIERAYPKPVSPSGKERP